MVLSNVSGIIVYETTFQNINRVCAECVWRMISIRSMRFVYSENP